MMQSFHNFSELDLPLIKIKEDLVDQAWSYLPLALNQHFSEGLLKLFLEKLIEDSFSRASVGRKTRKTLRENIRLCDTCWIMDWNESPELKSIFHTFQFLSEELNQYFYLSIKRFESQLACYPSGGFYKKHLDQLKGGNHRQLTCILYLNDCENGGELVLYDRNDKNKISAKISPQRGDMVFFFSGEIFHEVLTTRSPRFSLTTWFRDDFELFQPIDS